MNLKLSLLTSARDLSSSPPSPSKTTRHASNHRNVHSIQGRIHAASQLLSHSSAAYRAGSRQRRVEGTVAFVVSRKQFLRHASSLPLHSIPHRLENSRLTGVCREPRRQRPRTIVACRRPAAGINFGASSLPEQDQRCVDCGWQGLERCMAESLRGMCRARWTSMLYVVASSHSFRVDVGS